MNIVKISAHVNARIVKMDKRQLKNGLEMLEINIKNCCVANVKRLMLKVCRCGRRGN